MISIPSTLPYKSQLENELSKPTYKHDPAGKIIINKTPEGTKSPNLFDATVMSTFEIQVFDPNTNDIMGGPGGDKIKRLAA